MVSEYQVSNEEIDAFIDSRWSEFISDAEALISIDSSFDPSSAVLGAPFGTGPRKALDVVLAIASRMGFDVHDGDGYAGYADLSGESSQQLAIIGHVDVVPAGEGWQYPPFELTQKDGALIGRGTADDKIPLLCALYACRFWLDRGVSLRHSIRFIFGCNEETGMADVPYYLDHAPAPDFLFTPDADFPLCYGEKGLFGATFTYELPYGSPQAVVSFEGGTATNAVPAVARAVLRARSDELPVAERIALEPCDEGTLVTARGISGHASMPKGTVNAIGVLAGYLSKLRQCSERERTWFSFVSDKLAGSDDGSSMGIAASDDDFGSLTSVVGTMRKTAKGYLATVDVRFPRSKTGPELCAAFDEIAERMGASVSITRNQEPFIVDPKTAPVQALIRAYEQATGLEARPFTMGGATYAREFPHAVSFGPADPGALKKPEWIGEMHGANEGVSVEAIYHAIRIYARAFANLALVEELRA